MLFVPERRRSRRPSAIAPAMFAPPICRRSDGGTDDFLTFRQIRRRRRHPSEHRRERSEQSNTARSARSERSERSNRTQPWFRAGSGLIRSRSRSAGRIAHVGLSPASPRAR